MEFSLYYLLANACQSQRSELVDRNRPEVPGAVEYLNQIANWRVQLLGPAPRFFNCLSPWVAQAGPTQKGKVMADLLAINLCAHCGVPLSAGDIDDRRGTCFSCRSPAGKIAELDIAIRASGDNPERISNWPAIRHLLRKRFGDLNSNAELWERCTDWLRADFQLMPDEYLNVPLGNLQELLQHGFATITSTQLNFVEDQHQVAASPRVVIERPQLNASETSSQVLDLNQIAQDGNEQVSQATKPQPDNPIVVQDVSTDVEKQEKDLTLLGRFPETPAGHLAFLEFVCDELHLTAEAKRRQLDLGYSNATIESMLGGIKWAEASKRSSLLAELGLESAAKITRMLRQQTTAASSDRIAEVLSSEILALRESLEFSEIDATFPISTSGEEDSVPTQSSSPHATNGGHESQLSMRSTGKGEARVKIIAKLTQHHGYYNRSCKNFASIGVRQLAHDVGVAISTVSDFFSNNFGNHKQYTNYCADKGKLIDSLMLLNNELKPKILNNNLGAADRDVSDE